MPPNKRKCYSKSFFRFYHFFFFNGKKRAKFTKNKENWQNPNRLIEFSEIWYVDTSQQKKMLQFFFFGFRPFLAVFLTKKQPKLTKNEENWQNPNRLEKFSEIWYLDASQQKKMLQKTIF